MKLLCRSSVLCLAVSSFWGCGGGDSGPQKYSLTGKVTFNETPIPRGMIVFSPDARQDNRGPGAIAIIKDGQYSTEVGKGMIGGPHEIRINGFDGVAAGELIDGKPLFESYTQTVDLPRKSGTFDFNVPGNSKARSQLKRLPPP